MQEILEPASKGNNSVLVNCSVELSSYETITKQLLFEGDGSSDINFDCNGGVIDRYQRATKDRAVMIRSKKINGHWSIPHHITLKNCRIKGDIRVGENFTEESYRGDYVAKVRASAPHHIYLDHLRIESKGETHIYLHPGVHNTKVEHSSFHGKVDSVTIYLDAESYRNEILHNQFHARSDERDKHKQREVIAIDGSEHNTIAYNHFSAINFGGIFLYRNCGERGVVRWTTPSHNLIHHNNFYYKKYKGSNAAIHIASRNDRTREGTYSYCGKDDKYKIRHTSSSSNSSERLDNPIENQIYLNQFLNRDPDYYIQYGSSRDQSRNRVWGNVKVSKFKKWDKETQVKIITGGCKKIGNNRGCKTTLQCPKSYIAVAGKAACNLEFPNKSLKLGEWDIMTVVRQSDVTSSGSCHLGNTVRKSSVGPIDLNASTTISASCKEYDRNGGDCEIKAEIMCLPQN